MDYSRPMAVEQFNVNNIKCIQLVSLKQVLTYILC